MVVVHVVFIIHLLLIMYYALHYGARDRNRGNTDMSRVLSPSGVLLP